MSTLRETTFFHDDDDDDKHIENEETNKQISNGARGRQTFRQTSRLPFAFELPHHGIVRIPGENAYGLRRLCRERVQRHGRRQRRTIRRYATVQERGRDQLMLPATFEVRVVVRRLVGRVILSARFVRRVLIGGI